MWAVLVGPLLLGAAPEPGGNRPIIPDVSDAQVIAEPEEPESADLGFGFGSYGRVGAGTDLHGSTPRPVHVVAHGPRIIEDSYVELDLYYRLAPSADWGVTLVTTPAFTGDLFHYSGEFDLQLALRNLYAEAVYNRSIGVWVGSRMYRGDDIYLLDHWPLDNLNTVGGGAWYRADRFEGGLALGVNRLVDAFQFQQVEVPARLTGSETVVQLDRQRFVASLKSAYRFGPQNGPAMKLKGNLEVVGLPAGERQRDDQSPEQLASDFGYSVGAQLGYWGFAERNSHANLFLRFSQGLAAFDELQIPTGLDQSKQSFPGALEVLAGLSGNYETGDVGVLAGGYVRWFNDADRNSHDVDDGWEGVLDVRPTYTLFDFLQLAVDLSYQQRFPRGPSPTTSEVMNPTVIQMAPMLVLTPGGAGSYARPHVRLVYAAAHLNEGARDLYAFDDPRRDNEWVHFVGLQAEWWFNSTYR